jgi:hypothetical protein
MAFDYDRYFDNRQDRRLAAEPRQLAKIDREIDAADALVGELVRDGVKVFYINQLRKSGLPTGKVVEFKYRFQAAEYLIRNRYV